MTVQTRLGYDGLYNLVRDRLACDPLSGHLYLFANARRDRLEVLFFDGSGVWVCSKRMEGGRLRWPEADGAGNFMLFLQLRCVRTCLDTPRVFWADRS
jgi:transposase